MDIIYMESKKKIHDLLSKLGVRGSWERVEEGGEEVRGAEKNI